MAVPNAQNPTFPSVVTAAGFTNLSGSGICIVPVETSGITEINVFGATNGFDGKISGIFIISKAATTAVVNVSSSGISVCTINTSSTAGVMTGATSLAHRLIERDNTMSVFLSGAESGDGHGSATVFITYAPEK